MSSQSGECQASEKRAISSIHPIGRQRTASIYVRSCSCSSGTRWQSTAALGATSRISNRLAKPPDFQSTPGQTGSALSSESSLPAIDLTFPFAVIIGEWSDYGPEVQYGSAL
jgi:hypothetical protein